jgi:hypothetical protein
VHLVLFLNPGATDADGPAVDIYSLGVLITVILTGQTEISSLDKVL